MMKEVNNGWGFFRKKLQDYDMPAEKGDWAEFEQMFDQTPPPNPPVPNGGSSIFGGIVGKLIGFALIVSVAAITLYSITSGTGTTNDSLQNSNQSIDSPNSTNDNNSTLGNINSNSKLNSNQPTDKTSKGSQADKNQMESNEELTTKNKDQLNKSNAANALNQNEFNNIAVSKISSSASLENTNANPTTGKNISKNSTTINDGINTTNIFETVQQSINSNTPSSNVTNSRSSIAKNGGSKVTEKSNTPNNVLNGKNSDAQKLTDEKPNVISSNSNTTEQNIATSSLIKDKDNQAENIISNELPSFDWNQEIKELPKGDFQIPFLNGPDHSIDAYIDALIGPTELLKKTKRGIGFAVSTGLIYSSSAPGKVAVANPFIGAHVEIPVFKRGAIEIGLQHFRMGNFVGDPLTEIITFGGVESERITTFKHKKYDFIRIPLKYKHYLNNRRIALSAGISISGEDGYHEETEIEIVNTSTTTFNGYSSSGYDFSFSNIGINLGAEYQLNNKFSMYIETELNIDRGVYDNSGIVGEPGDQAPSVLVVTGLKWHPFHLKKDKLTYLALKAVGGSTIGLGSNDHSLSASYLFGGNLSYRFGKTWEVETGLEIFRVNGYKNAAPFERTNNIAGGIETNFFEPISTWKLQAKYPLRIKKHFNEKWVGYAGVAFSDAYDYNSRTNVTTSFSNSSIVNNSVQTTGSDIVITNDNAWSLSVGGEYKIRNGLSIFGDLEYYVVDGHRSAGAATGPLVNTGVKYTLFRL